MATPVATPTPTDIDKQAATLREQAAGLNRRQADREEAVRADHGSRFDDAVRNAAEANAAATTATDRANEMHGRAKESLDVAKRLEQDADQRSMSVDPAEREFADDYREQAQLARASASSYTQRAQRSEQVARQKLDEAERAERQAIQIQRSHDDATAPLDHMRHTANQLEDKATVLERAADELRAADRAPTAEQRSAHLGKAQVELARADVIKPDFSRLAPADVVAAGIPMTEVPGAELMQPDSLVDPVIPGAGVNDTDLMQPDSLDDPVNPGAGDDTDLMHPDAQSGLPAADDGLVDPLGVGASASSAAADTQRWDANGDSGPDSYVGAADDPGDLGLDPVDAVEAPASEVPAPAVDPSVSSSLDEEAYMDQPDPGTTGPYLDAYGDTADVMGDDYVV